MASQSIKSANKALHHDFDALRPVSGIETHVATPWDIPQLAALARETVPGVDLSADDLAAYCRINRRTAFSFRRNSELIGGIAFLFLNDDGLDALILDDIDLRHPHPRFLAGTDETPAAIYWWALAARGRGVGGLGQLAQVLSSPQYRQADFYAQPSSREGERMSVALGFERVPSWQRDLWMYRRAANRDGADLETKLRHAA